MEVRCWLGAFAHDSDAFGQALRKYSGKDAHIQNAIIVAGFLHLSASLSMNA